MSHRSTAACAVGLLVCLFLLVSLTSAGAATLIDQGWWVQDVNGVRSVQCQAGVLGDTDTAESYRVKFTMAYADLSAYTEAQKAAGQVKWEPMLAQTTEMQAVAPGSVAIFRTGLPYSISDSSKVYRFEAHLLLNCTDRVLSTIVLTQRFDCGIAAANRGAGGAGVAGGAGGAGAALVMGAVVAAGIAGMGTNHLPAVVAVPPTPVSGSGTMTGTHTSVRSGGQWVEQGSGTLTVSGGSPDGSSFQFTTQYTYSASGPNSSSLVANGTGSPGRVTVFTGTSSQTYPVTQISVKANLTTAGTRSQSGAVVTRTGGSGTGTFSMKVREFTYTGVLSFGGGIQTLNLVTGQGSHSFNVTSFSASR